MKLGPLDEFPIHQTAAPISTPATSDRNFYDRWYFNVMDHEGRFMVLTGMGYYPRLGTKDAYLIVRRGDITTAVHLNDAIDDDRMHPHVMGYRLDVVEPLQEFHIVVEETEGIAMDVTWRGAFPPTSSLRLRRLDECRRLIRDQAGSR